MKWEYEVCKNDHLLPKEIVVSLLNQMGQEGWELASVVVPADERLMLFFFKRPAVPTDVPREVASEKAAVSPQAASPEAQETEALPCPK